MYALPMKLKRVLLIVLAVLAVVAVAAAILLPRFLNPERYRPKLEAMLAEVTGRKVAVGPMALHVFPLPGITAEGFELGEDPAFGTGTFLKAGTIDARVRLLPLLSSKLDVVSFDVRKPEAHLHRNAKGRWNVTSLIEASSKTAPAGAPPAPAPSGGGFAIVIERFRLIDGTFDVTDAAIIPGKTHVIDGRSIQLALSDLSLGSAVGIDLELGLTGPGKLKLTGTIGPAPKTEADGWPIDGKAKVTDFIGGAAAPYLATYTGIRLDSGALDLEAAVKGKVPQAIDVKGSLVLKKLVFALAGGAPNKIPLDARVDLDGSLSPDETDVKKAAIKVGGAAVTLSGKLTGLRGTPIADVRAVADKVAFKDVLPIVALAGPFVPPGVAQSGTISLDATAKGPLSDPAAMRIEGTATMVGIELSDPSLKQPVRGIGGTIALKGDRAELTGLTASLGKSKVAGACSVTRFTKPIIDVNLTSPLIDVDEILSLLPAASGASKGGEVAARKGETSTPSMLGEVTVRGDINVDQVKAMNLKLTSAHAKLDVAGGQAKLHDVGAKLYGGSLAAEVGAGLMDAGPPFTLTGSMKGVDFNGLLSDFSKDMAGILYGTLETSLDVRGRGMDSKALQNNLLGKADLALRNGKLTSFGFLKQLAGALQAAGGRGIGKDETPFDSLTGTFDIHDGKANTQNLKLDSTDLDINGKGAVGLNQSLGMDVGVRLSPAVTNDMVAKTAQLKNLVAPSGELALDLKVGGTLQKPSIGVDPKFLKRAAEKTLKEKGKDALLKLFEKKKP